MKRVLVIAMFAVLAGCNSVKAPFEGRKDPYSPSQVSFASQWLHDSTAVGTPIAVRDENGILQVTVPIRSTINDQMYVDYRVSFLDRNGTQLTQSGWLSKTLTPNVQDQVAFNSSSPQAADFHVDFRLSVAK